MTSLPTITTNILQHAKEEDTTLSHNFGVIHMTMPSTPLVNKPYHIVLTLDRSGSMMPVMDEVKHTLKNMLDYLCEIDCDEIYVSILFFDHEIISISTKERLTTESKKYMLEMTKQVEARGSTNIEKAFQKIKDLYMEDASNIHIFMTDGAPTEGEGSSTKLSNILDERYEHNFLGFGTNHNERLLYTVTLNTSGNYYFVDSIENAGLIYGEVLNKILYRRYESVKFTSESIEFYNYKKNIWEKSSVLGHVGSEDTFAVHFRFNWDMSIPQLVYRFHVRTNQDTESLDSYEQSALFGPDEYYPEVSVPSSARAVDVEKYYYRQLVMETMYEVNHKPTRLFYTIMSQETCNKVETLYTKIQSFMEDKDLTEDLFMKQLLDDMAITHKTLINPRLSAYAVARQVSQGDQRAYNVINMSPPDSSARLFARQSAGGPFPTAFLHRNIDNPNLSPIMADSQMLPLAQGFDATSLHTMDPTLSALNYQSQAELPIQRDTTIGSSPEPHASNIFSHSLSQANTSVYTTPQQMRMMSGVQQGSIEAETSTSQEPTSMTSEERELER